ncbi:hypothetical protein [Prevotella dentasini]|nr:hypothetical protein [Prevotella dentasini]
MGKFHCFEKFKIVKAVLVCLKEKADVTQGITTCELTEPYQ